MKNSSYKILPTTILNEFLEKKNGDFLWQVDFNLASVFLLEDNTYIVFPGYGDEGLLFKSKDEMESMIQSRFFPVKGDGSFWDIEKDKIVNIDQNLEYFLNKLTETFHTEFNLDLNKERLDSISHLVIRKKNQTGLTNYEKDLLALFVAALIKKKINGKWGFTTIYALNPYTIPEVYDKFGNWYYSIIARVLSFLESKYNKFIDFHSIIQELSIL